MYNFVFFLLFEIIFKERTIRVLQRMLAANRRERTRDARRPRTATKKLKTNERLNSAKETHLVEHYSANHAATRTVAIPGQKREMNM
jgi:hypothetical protein